MGAWNRRNRIVAAYAVIAGVVLVGTSLLLEYIAVDGAPDGGVELVKNALFVVVSSVLLYALLKRHRTGAETGTDTGDPGTSPGPRLLAPLLLVLALTVPALSLAVYVLNARAGIQDSALDMHSLAALKAQQIADWVGERRGDAMTLAHSEGFIDRVAAYVLSGDERERELVADRLSAMHRFYNYESIRLYTPEGRLLFSSTPQRAAVEPAAQLIQESIRRGEVLMSDLARDDTGAPVLFFVAPLLHRQDTVAQPLGAVVLQPDAAAFLQPLLKYWPGESASGESYIMRRHGGAVLVLSSLRHEPGTGADLDTQPTAQEIHATVPGVTFGVDYRGRRVIEAHEPVPGTDWHLVAKVDRGEATAAARQMAAWTTIISLLAFSVVLLAVLALARAQERAHRLALQARTDRLQKLFFDLPFIGMGITSPESKHWLQYNDQLCRILGYSREELATVTWTDQTHPEDLAADVIQFERVLRGELDAYMLEKRYVRKDGGIVHGVIDIRALRRPDGSVEHFLCTLQDITERKVAEERLANLGRLYATLGRCNSAIVHSTTEDELFTQVCIAAVESAGMKMAWIGMVDKSGTVRPVASAGPGGAYLDGLEIPVRGTDERGRGPTGIAIREDRPVWCQDFANDPLTAPWHQRAAPYGWAASASLPLHRGGLAVGALSLYSGQRNAFDKQTRDLLLEMAGDISFALDNLAREHARQRAEELTQALVGQLEYYLKSSPVVSYALAADGTAARAVWVSDNVQRLTGYTPEQALAPGWWLENVHAEDRERVQHAVGRAVGAAPTRHDYRFRHRDGHYLWVLDTFQVLPAAGGGTQVIGAWLDITPEKEARASLQVSEERFRVMFEEAPLGMTLVDSLDGRILEVNRKFTDIIGRSREALTGLDWQSITHPDDVEADLANMALLNAGKVPGFHMRKRYLRPDGAVVWVNLTVAPIRSPGARPRHLAMTEDITESERTLQALARREAQFRALAEQSIAGIYTAEDGRITYMNPRAAEIFGYTQQEIIGMTAADLVAPVDLERVRENIRRRLAGEEQSQQYEFTGLRKDGSTVMVGVHGNTAVIEGRSVLMGVLQDITEKQRATAAINDYMQRLDRMLTSTVDAMSTLVELRDPYTAGHERRVGELSAAIAAEMGLDENMQRGLRLAGAVHDVGKIAVPAEILSKPGRLTSIERDMVREHAQRGYEVLQGIDSPWPVAEVARQHHERMDGSGYPRGLKGTEILLEARILAVADVVESMGSFRPYRPRLGIEPALAEIEGNAGRLYDADVAAACLRLFRERGYVLPA